MRLVILLLVLMFVYGWYALAEDVSIEAVIQIESGFDPSAFNASSQACGLMQITPICLQDYNNFAKAETFNIGDMFDGGKNVRVGQWYLEKRIPAILEVLKIESTVENILISYNWGCGNLVKYLKGKKRLPRETVNYLKKYRQIEGGNRAK